MLICKQGPAGRLAGPVLFINVPESIAGGE
jgi:hypothetical protein